MSVNWWPAQRSQGGTCLSNSPFAMTLTNHFQNKLKDTVKVPDHPSMVITRKEEAPPTRKPPAVRHKEDSTVLGDRSQLLGPWGLTP